MSYLVAVICCVCAIILTLVSQTWPGSPCLAIRIVYDREAEPEQQTEFPEKAKFLVAKRIEYPSKLFSRWIFHNQVGRETTLDNLG